MIQLSLRNKFILAFMPLMVVIFLFGILSIRTLDRIHTRLSNLNQNLTRSALAMMEIKAVQATLVAAVSEGSRDTAAAAAGIQRLRELVKKHRDLESHSHEAGRKTAHTMMHHAIRIISLSQYLMDNGFQPPPEGGDLAPIYALLEEEQRAIGPLLEEHLSTHLQELSRTEALISEQYRESILLVGAGIAATILLTVCMLVYLMRSVAEPVRKLHEGIRQVGAGDLDCNIDVQTGDELEELAGAFHEMAEKLSHMYAGLDSKVQERTAALRATNEELRREVADRKRAQEEQQRIEEQVHFLSQELLRVQETERQQISLDLHDNVAQELSSLKVALETGFADLVAPDPQGRKALEECDNLLKRAIRTVRELSYNLRPPGLEQMGVASSMADYCRSFSKKNGIAVDFAAAGMEKLQIDYACSINLYRLVQEALHNCWKHARAEKITVRLVASFPHIILRIEDDGQGFEVAEGLQRAFSAKRLGLLGMQERVKLLGGEFAIHSRLQEGTKISIEVPWDRTNDQEERTHS